MWEAIAANRRRSWVLISLMGILLVALGAAIGGYVAPPDGVAFGAGIAALLWLILWLTAAGAGDRLLLSVARAREIQKADAPQLWNVVEEMTIAAGLPKVPRIFIIDDAALNAFAVGSKPEKAAVAVTSGLLKRLNRDELQGVIAHEMGHIRNLDVRFLTLASVMLGAIVLIAEVFLRSLWYGGGAGRRRSSSDRGGGQAQIILLVAAIALAILAPLLAQLLYFACSRRREFLADASSARFTRYPPGLASALAKISSQAGLQVEVSKPLAPLYIINPLQEAAAFSLFSTHPPTKQRIDILQRMGGASFAAYEDAYRAARGGRGHCIGQQTLTTDEAVEMRAALPEEETRAAAVERAQAVGALLDTVVPLVVIPCACGVRLKLTPGDRRESIACPRCGTEHAVPQAEAGPAGPDVAHARKSEAPLRYRRRGTGWESFRCVCGQPVQISPKFGGTFVRCKQCRRTINVTAADLGAAGTGG